MACRNCKPSFSEGATYCPYCGEDQMRWKLKRHALFILIGILMLVLLAALFFILTTLPPL
jgi:hypothetical protein